MQWLRIQCCSCCGSGSILGPGTSQPAGAARGKRRTCSFRFPALPSPVGTCSLLASAALALLSLCGLSVQSRLPGGAVRGSGPRVHLCRAGSPSGDCVRPGGPCRLWGSEHSVCRTPSCFCGPDPVAPPLELWCRLVLGRRSAHRLCLPPQGLITSQPGKPRPRPPSPGTV